MHTHKISEMKSAKGKDSRICGINVDKAVNCRRPATLND